MLEAGYTAVCEFHYLHHPPDGRPYDDPAAMSRALIEAARETGIRLTLLPVLYMAGGFDGRPLAERQRRFGHDVDGYLRLLDALRPLEDDTLRVGCALHSLRAVPEAAMRDVLAGLPSTSRVHVHIAEQIAEVDECIALRGQRPVQWLLANAEVDARWTLVHATHLDDGEVAAIAASRRDRRDLPDHRSQPRRRPVPAARVPRRGRAVRHRLGLARVDVGGGRTALARIRAAAGGASPQRGGGRLPKRGHHAAFMRRGIGRGRQRPGDGR